MTDEAANDERTPFREWPTAGRRAAYVAGTLVLLLLIALLSGASVVRKSFPQVDGTLKVKGLEHPVEVRRDAHGIPQLYADTSADLFFAQGFVQAQDRFFEMDFRRHVTAGRLSELVGKSGLETDMAIRTMGWRRVAEAEYPRLALTTRSYLRSFSDGVNAYLSSRSASKLSLEYAVLAVGGLDYKPEKWTPIDSLAWLKAMAWDLRGNMTDEIDRARLSAGRTKSQIAELYPAYPYDLNQPIMGWTSTPGTATTEASVGGSAGLGSNSWVVSGAHTTTGQPLLANDPHLSPSLPGIWYQMGLHCRVVNDACPFDVSGFTFAGLPGVVIGHNGQIAWGFTNLGPDVTDLFLEKVEGHNYLYGGKWHPLTERDEVIRVAGGPSKTITVRSTRHGPLLSDVSSDVSSVGANARVPAGSPNRGNGYGVSLEWTALHPTRTADAVFALDGATNWAGFRAAAELFAVPSQNLVYADTSGNIGYQAPGLVPIRKNDRSGDYPVPGWLPSNDWTGRYVPFTDLPHELNPPEGFIVTANQAVVGANYPYRLGDSWDAGYRSQRIRDLLSADLAKAPVDGADMARIQNDTRNPMAPILVPYLLRVILPSKYYADGQRLLATWDFRQPADSAAAAYFNAVWSNLLRLTFHDQLRPSLWPNGNDRWMMVVTKLLKDPSSSWWDDSHTDDIVENRDIILAEAMRDARDELTRRIGSDPGTWTWGAIHHLNLENATLGQSNIGLVRALFNRGPEAVGGGSAIVDATAWDASSGYDVTAAPSMRMIVDLADFDDSEWINLTGASGHAFNRNYTDQANLWRSGKYLPWAWSAKAVAHSTRHTLTLKPG